MMMDIAQSPFIFSVDSSSSTPPQNAVIKKAMEKTSISLSIIDDEENVPAPPRPFSQPLATDLSDANIKRPIHGIKWLLVCFSLYVSSFLYGLDTTIAADVQGPIVSQLGHVDKLSWIGSGFPLGSIAIILFVGNLYGNFNNKWIYIRSMLLFEVGSVLCGAAPTMDALIAGRVLAGSGGSGVYLGCLNYFTFLTTPHERGLYISLCGFFWGIGAVLGPVVGGAFTVTSASGGGGWRSAFYVNLIIGALAAPVYLFYLPSMDPNKGKGVRERLRGVDFLGLVLIGVAWVTYSVGFAMAGINPDWPWDGAKTIAVLLVFGVVLVAAVMQQYFTVWTTPERRAFPGRLLRSGTQVLLYVVTSCATSSLFVVLFYIPIYFQFVHSDTAIQAAVRLLPFVVITVVTNIGCGHLLSKTNIPYMGIYLLAGVLITIGGSLLTVYIEHEEVSEGMIYGFTIITAVGTGLTLQTGYAVATLSVPKGLEGHAINLQNVSQVGGTVICAVIAGQTFQSVAVSRLTAVLAGQGFSRADISGAVAGAQSKLFEQLTPGLREAATGAIMQAMQKTFVLVIVAGAVMVAAAVFMKRERLFKKEITLTA
ncbi:major facilitator superfamily domain-containing protein [Diplogelasinospora grovesii]|uniref:Major facilitator superfamily domain-containing protein n=1 Tax=Diplogelasinospora grovesii TaxID=303347 RepID=A0AAN6MUI1_9PEZI|nr:major facilitator superfamily domain-containing protein [Diplogelasinospora grovesii]